MYMLQTLVAKQKEWKEKTDISLFTRTDLFPYRSILI